jgi:hypothetical protein
VDCEAETVCCPSEIFLFFIMFPPLYIPGFGISECGREMQQLGTQHSSEGKRTPDTSKRTLESKTEKALTEISLGWIYQVAQDGVQ